MKPTLLMLAVLYCQWSTAASCMLSKIQIEDRTAKAQVIVDGEVTAQHTYWNTEKSSIYTVNTVEVSNQLKGGSAQQIEVITPGGELDGRLLIIEPNADLQVGSKGIFFLSNNTIALNYVSSASKYEIYSLAQGFIKEDILTGKYNDPFDEYENRTVVYSKITKVTGNGYRMLNSNYINNVVGASISSLSPTNISAGTQQVLTITGKGFGIRSGAATVQFKDVNYITGTTNVSVPDTSYIVSWSDTEIKVIVPGASVSRQSGAATGSVNVIDANGGIITSPSALNITYNQFEYKKKRITLINQNRNGGYTVTLNSNLSTNAKDVFKRALDQWTCNTGVNVNISNTSSATTCNSQMDNVNIISFADASCPLPAGALAATYSSYSVCGTSPVMPDGFDMIFSPSANFNFSTGNPASNQYDFESVVLHELGHAFGEGHHSNSNEIMYPSIANGVVRRKLNAYTDIKNIEDVVLRSSTATDLCGYTKYTNNNAPCRVVSSLKADFTTNKITGCAPLTVTFSDISTGTPLTWNWDMDNNGSIDDNTQNPSFEFKKAGSYSVRLVISNAIGSDSITKTAIITVNDAMQAKVEVMQNATCYGSSNGILQAGVRGGNGSYAYTWSNGQNTSTINNLTPGIYTVNIQDGNGCVVTASNIVSQPEPITIALTTALIDTLYTATLEVSGGTPAYNYYLNNTANTRTSSTNGIFTGLTTGDYSATITDKNNCTQNYNFSIAAPTPTVNNTSKIADISVFPNPAVNQLNFNLSLREESTVTVELFDISGSIVFQNEYNNVTEQESTIDVSNLASGTYVLKFELPGENTFKKIIINR